jgi:hypothetical protein
LPPSNARRSPFARHNDEWKGRETKPFLGLLGGYVPVPPHCDGEVLPPGCVVTILADRGFGDHKLAGIDATYFWYA